MSYREHRPANPLVPFVDRFWTRVVTEEERDAGRPLRVLPDGCIDLIVNLATGETDVVGTMTRALVIPALEPARLVGLRFRPGGALPFLGIAADALTDQSIGLGSLGRPHGLTLERTAGVAPGEARTILESALLARLSRVLPPDPAVAHAVRRLFERRPPSTEALARELGWSRQHLRRKLLEHVGVAPKELGRIARLQRAVAFLQRPRSRGLAAAAIELGYFDQAHMARDFRLLAGLTAVEARAATGSIFPIRSLLGPGDSVA